MTKELTKAEKEDLVGFTDELHQRLHTQARNLLLEYRLSSNKCVPVDQVEKLIRLYGYLIAEEFYKKAKENT